MSTDNGKPRHLPEIPDEHWDALNDIRKTHEETWAETFERFNNYRDWVEHLFELPKESPDSAKLNAVTVTGLMPLWLDNIRNNFIKDVEIPDIHEIKDTVEPDTPGLVIGAGPSLLENNQLKTLHDSVFYQEHKGVIVSTAHSLKWCLEAGVIPDYITMIDANIKMVDFINHQLVEAHSEKITGIFTLTVHPDVFDHWNGKKLFFMPAIPHITIPNVQSVLAGLFPEVTVFDCMANCGSFSWNIARYAGCNPIGVIGLDFAFKPDFPIKDTPYYNAYRPSYDSEKEMIEKCYRFHTHSFFGKNCYTDHIHDSFRKTFEHVCQVYNKQLGITTQNCTGGGIIDDEAIENMHFADWLKKWE